jgi:hypothetical protein
VKRRNSGATAVGFGRAQRKLEIFNWNSKCGVTGQLLSGDFNVGFLDLVTFTSNALASLRAF